MLPNGCWGDVHDFLNDQKASLAAFSPRHHPQHGHDPGHFRLDRCGFAVPCRRRAPRVAPCGALSRRDGSRGGCPARSGAHRRPWPRSLTQALSGPGKGSWVVRRRCRRWPRSASRAVVVRGRCWGCPPPEVGRGATPMRLPTPCPPRGLLRLMPWPIRAPSGGGGGGGVRAASCVAVRRGRCSSWSQAGGGSTGRSGADPKLVAVWRRRGGSGPAPTPWHMLRCARASGRVLRRAARAAPCHTHRHAGDRWLVAAAVVRWCGAQGPVLVLTVLSGARGGCGSRGCAGPGASVRAPVLVMMRQWPSGRRRRDRHSAKLPMPVPAGALCGPRPRPAPVTE